MKNRYFQWVAGDRRGEVLVLQEIVEEDGDTYLSFRDNSRINTEFVAEINQTDLTKKMMAEVESPNNIWKFQEKDLPESSKPRVEQDWESQVNYEVPSVEEIIAAETGTPLKPKKKIIDLIPPRPTTTKFGKLASTSDMAEEYNKSVIEKQAISQQTATQNDPVWVMMDKAKKFDTEVPMTLTISLPSKSLYAVAKESFEEGGPKVIEYIISNLDDKKLKDALKNALYSAYEGNQQSLPVEKTQIGVELFEPDTIEEPIIKDQKPALDLNKNDDDGNG